MKRSKKRERKRLKRAWFALGLCLLLMLLCLAYMLRYEYTRRSIQRDNAAFSALYQAPTLSAAGTPLPVSPTATSFVPSPSATNSPAPASAGSVPALPAPESAAESPPSNSEISLPLSSAAEPPAPASLEGASASSSAGSASFPSVSSPPDVDASPSAAPSPSGAEPTVVDTPLQAAPAPASAPAATPAPSFAIAVDATVTPRATADEGTLVLALETPPPVQQSFSALLAANPDTVGFLNIMDVLSLPVVQRRNDNEYYLTHSFDGEESNAGTLFLDGANLLVPEDNCLLIYGHNMKNGTMFRPLLRYEELPFLREHPLVRFDTLYRNRAWAPFAALTITAEADSPRYLDIRRLSLDETGFDLFVRSLRTLSVWDSPVDVSYGDSLLLLVTCEYTHDDGRFVLALRAQRPGEDAARLQDAVLQSK